MMKFTFALFAILATIGLSQSHQYPDFGHGPLHEDFQDILDLVPAVGINIVATDYVLNDAEVQAVVNFLKTTPVLKNVVQDFEAIPEVIDLLNYLQDHGIQSYYLINQVNHVLKIAELVPPTPTPTPTPTLKSRSFHTYNVNKQRTGGLAGLFKDIKDLFNFESFISLYVDKLRDSPAFTQFINYLRHDKLQAIVNQLYESQSFQVIVHGLKEKHVNLKIVKDVLYLVFNVTVPGSPKTLLEELGDFLELLPWEKIVDVIVKYVNEDKEVQNAIQFLFTSNFHSLLRAVEALKEHKDFVVYFQKVLGLDIIQQIQEFHKAIGMEEYVPPKIESFLKSLVTAQEVGGGFKALLKDIYDLLPLKEIDALHQEKLKTSKVFSEFIAKITSPEFASIIKNLDAQPAHKDLVEKCNNEGLDLVGIAIVTNRIIGLKFPAESPKTLLEELGDFLELLPWEKIVDVIVKYANEDKEVQNAILFLLTPDFHSLLRAVEALKEHKDFVVYVQKVVGLDIIQQIQEFHKAIGMEEYVPPKIESFLKSLVTTQEVGGGFQAFLKDIYFLLPLDDIDALHQEKLKTSKVFSEFITKITSPEFVSIAKNLIAQPAHKDLIEKSNNQGLDLVGIAIVTNRIFGLKFPAESPKTLLEELGDFLELLPWKKIIDVIVKYANEDKEVQNAIQFLFTSNFHSLLRAVEALKEHKDFVVYVQKVVGLDIIQQIQEFHKAIGMEEYVPPKIESFLKSLVTAQEVGGGFQAFLRDIYLLLPLEEIDALHQEKLKTSKVFSEFITKITSPEFASIVTNLGAQPAHKELVEKCNNEGLDLVGITIVTNRIFGLRFPVFLYKIQNIS